MSNPLEMFDLPPVPSVQESSSQRPSVFTHNALRVLEQMLQVEREATRIFLEARHEELLRACSSQAGKHCNNPRASPLLVVPTKAIARTEDVVLGRSSTTTTPQKTPHAKIDAGSHSVARVLSEASDGTRSPKNSLSSIRAKPKPKIRRNPSWKSDHSQGSRFTLVRVSEATARSDMFEIVFGILIILNSFVMCFEAQYWGHDSAYLVDVGSRQASDVWPKAEMIFRIMDVFFGIIFSCEVIIKAIGLRLEFLASWWNLFDSIIIVSWLMYAVGDILPVNPFFLRLIRLARLIRLLRLVKTIQVFDILHLMAASLTASVYVLFWSVVLLLGVMTSAALIMANLIEFYIEDASISLSNRQDAYKYFGNFSRSLLSVFEITLGNWAPLTRFLHEEVSEYFGIVIMVYHCIVSFAVVMVIRGVFLHETFQAAEENDDLLILGQRRRKANAIRKIESLFHEADIDLSGFLSREEFTEIMHDPRVNMWLEALGLEVRDAHHLFDVMDDGDGQISAEEFIHGFARLKGPAKSVDMVQVLRLARIISELAHNISVAVGVTRNGLAEYHQVADTSVHEPANDYQLESAREPANNVAHEPDCDCFI